MPPLKEKTFVRSFLQWYQLLAAIFVIVIALSIGFVFRYSILMQLEEITQNNNVTAGYLISNHLHENHQGELALLSADDVAGSSKKRALNFASFNAHVLSVMPSINVILIKLYDKSGAMVYSSSDSLFEDDHEVGPSLQSALEGTISTELETPDKNVSTQSPLSGKYYAETYFPLYADHTQKEVVGALELYLDVSRQFSEFKSILILFALIVVGIIFFMYLWGRLLISPAERLMRLQHARQQKLRAAIEKAPIGIILSNGVPEKNRITYANAAAGLLLNKAPRAMMGQSVSDLTLDNHSVTASQYKMQGSHAITSKTQMQTDDPSGAGKRWVELIVGSGVFTDSIDNEKPFLITIVSDIHDRKEVEAKQALLSEVVEKSINAIEVLDHLGRYEYVNKAAENLHGIKMTKILGQTPETLDWLGEESDDVYRKVYLALSAGVVSEGIYSSKDVNGQKMWLESSVFNIDDPLHHETKTVVIQRDITEQVVARLESQKLFLAIEQSTTMIMITTVDGVIDYVNPSFLTRSGYTAEEVIGHNPRILQSGHTPHTQYQKLWNTIIAGENWLGEMLNKTKNGELFWVKQRISPLRDEGGKVTHFVGILEDITEQKAAIDRLNFLAMHDDLTDLSNRTAFNQRLEFLLSLDVLQRPKSAVLLINVDRFKDINNDFGQEMGDQILREIGNRIRSVCQKDDLIARLQGDEFGVICSHVSSLNGASDLASRLIDAVAQPFLFQGLSIRVSISIGVELVGTGAQEVDTIMRHVELALSTNAPRVGGEVFFFEKEMDEAVARFRNLASDLKEAIEQESFVLYFQPVVNQPSGKIRSFEALLRWNHHSRGWVSPVDFIPVAEQTGLIVPLGEWVVREACLQIKRWSEQGWEIPIAVNLSIVQFRSGQLHWDIQRIINETGIKAHLLHFEITESLALGSPEVVLPSLHYFHDLGMEILLDDFGTGYSSLSQLISLPIDRLKIDRSFLQEIREEAIDDRVIKSIIKLGSSLNKFVTVEGVETQFQEQVLVNLGCVDFQGFYFYKPMSEADATAALLENTRIGDQADRVS